MSDGFDPLVPRSLDLPTAVPLDVDLSSGPAAEALDEAKILAAPDDPADLPRWRAQLAAWRAGARARHGHTGERYDRPEAAWAATCFTVAQVWLWDELFFDAAAQRFTPDRFLADARERLGGVDGVVLWHAYPVIGIDDRNQWDFYRDVPGLPDVVAALQGAGVRVFVDYNPWDTGTRRGHDDVTELADVVRLLGADGVFLDTLKKAEPALVGALEAARPGIALEGESKLATERVADHALSWAQWFADSGAPGVLRAHLYERRHMQHHVRRWNRDHSAELQSAWVNGVGLMVWEVVFGVWVGWNERDATTLRRMLPVQRRLSRLLVDGEWVPLAPLLPGAREAGVHASSFTRNGVTLWTLVNRSTADVTLPVLDAAPGRWVDLHAGRDADPRPATGPVTVRVPGRGVAAVLHVAEGARRPRTWTRCSPSWPPCRSPATRRSCTAARCACRRPCRWRPGTVTRRATSSSCRRGSTSSRSATARGRPGCTTALPTSRSGSPCRRGCTTPGRSSASSTSTSPCRSRRARCPSPSGTPSSPRPGTSPASRTAT